MSDKPKYPRADAIAVARELVGLLPPCCSRLLVAGSLRRRKKEVGDVELLYIPNFVQGTDPNDLFAKPVQVNAVDVALGILLEKGLITRRLNKLERPSWGPENKLAVHAASGIPVDLFSATPANWWNLTVCRTGGRQNNEDICNAAIERGWKWRPYQDGFSRPNPERNGWLLIKEIHSEPEVFEWVGMNYLEPWERE